MSNVMTVKELITELEKHNPEAEALIVLTVGKVRLLLGHEETSWYAIASVADGGWKNEDGTSPIIGLYCGELIVG